MQREISNFEYLIQLNTIAGRTYNDLSQYPVVSTCQYPLVSTCQYLSVPCCYLSVPAGEYLSVPGGGYLPVPCGEYVLVPCDEYLSVPTTRCHQMLIYFILKYIYTVCLAFTYLVNCNSDRTYHDFSGISKAGIVKILHNSSSVVSVWRWFCWCFLNRFVVSLDPKRLHVRNSWPWWSEGLPRPFSSDWRRQ